MNNVRETLNVPNKKIANIYYFNYEGDMGFYKSYRNFCLNNMISLNLAIPGKKISHVYPSPSTNKVSEESTKQIQDFVAERLGLLTQIEKPVNYEVSEYFTVMYTDGTSNYFQFDNNFFQIFKMANFISGECKTLLTPYLVFEDREYATKISILESIKKAIGDKKIRDILPYISNDCILEEKYGTYNCIKTKKEIDKEIKRRIGFMGTKASKAYIIASLEGSLNDVGESIVEIKIETRPAPGQKVIYLLSPEFNEANEISNLKFTLFDKSKKDTKTIFGDALTKAKQANYNDYKTT